MRVAPAGKELFGQRDGGDVGTGGLAGGIERAGAGRQNLGPPERLLHANTRRPGKYELMSRFAFSSKSVIRGMLPEHAAKVGFRSEIAGRDESIQHEIASFRAFQRIVPLVVDERETRTAHAGGKRENRNFAGRKTLREVAGFHQAKIPAIRK